MRVFLEKAGVVVRGVLVVATVALVLFSVWRVATRPWRAKPTTPGQQEIVLIHWGDDTENRIVQRIVDAFHAAHPEIRVRRVCPGNAPDVTRKIQTMIAAGAPPDVFYLGYEQVAPWGAKGLLEPLEPYIERDQRAGVPGALSLSDFYENVIDCFRFDAEEGVVGRGPLLGIAKDFSTVGFYYNRTLFRQAGLADPPASGWTWDEFLHACREIGKLPNCFGAEFVTWEAMIQLMVWTEGAVLSDDGFRTFDLTAPGVVAALEKLRGWFDEGRTLMSAKTQLETSSDPFLRGNVGLAGPYGRWKVPVYREIKDFDWDFAPLPHAAGKPPANAIFTTAWAMSSQGEKKEAAWTFVRFVSGEVGQTLISQTGLAIPTMIRVAESPAFKGPEKPENDDVYLAAVEHARPIGWPADQRMLHQLRVRMEEVFKIGSRSVPDGLAQVQREWLDFRRRDKLREDYAPMPWRAITYWITGVVAIVLGVIAVRWWRGRPGRMAAREEVAGLLMVSPWLIGFVLLTAFPVVLSLLLSVSRWSGLVPLGRAEFVGWDNFVQLFYDDTFMRSLRVTALYALLAVPIGQLAALGAAVLMNHEVRGVHLHRAAWYLPGVLAGVAMALLWARVFNHEHGLLNTLLEPLARALDTMPPRWFERDADTWAVPAFVIMSLWNIGGTMMIYLAGLKGIPQELYEAAHIDGAAAWRRFVNVTLPMLSPVIFFNVIIAIIASFQIFTQAYVITGGGPGDATRFYVVYLYNQAFDLHEMGYASALAWLLLVIVLVLTLAVMRGSRRFVYYEALKG